MGQLATIKVTFSFGKRFPNFKERRNPHMANDLSKVIALADLGEALLAAVKESGLARIKHRRASSTNGRRGKRQA